MTADFPRLAPAHLIDSISRTALTNVTRAGLWNDATREFFAELRAPDALAISCMEQRGGLVVGRVLGTRGAAPRPHAVRVRVLAREVRRAHRARELALALGGRSSAPALLTLEGEVIARDRRQVSDSSLAMLRALVRAGNRGKRRDRPAYSPAWWRSIVSGRWALLDDYEDCGRRCVLVVPTTRAERGLRRLSPRESAALARAIEGWTTKAIADELQVSKSAAYALVSAGLNKLGARGVAEVSTLAHALPNAVFSRFSCGPATLVAIGLPVAFADDYATLTPAERAIIPDLLASMSHVEIAARRHVAVRTIANQVGSIYKKLGVSGRAQLALRFSNR